VVPAGTLRQLVEFAEAHPEAGMFGPRLTGADGRPQISYRRRPTLGALCTGSPCSAGPGCSAARTTSTGGTRSTPPGCARSRR
jgi:hypothetical protein